jgi:uncharacterized repeat protein (TIGR04052 family)
MSKTMISQTILGAACFALPALMGCTQEAPEPRTVSISFATKVGNEAFSCTASYGDLGTKKTSAEPLDMRMYVHDVHLVRADGSEEPVVLDQDGQWQRGNLAFLDFEDGTGTCQTGSPEMRTKITGTIPDGDYVGLGFSVGVPPEENHLDAATAPAPLNIPGMWWSWKGGYKFMRLEMQTPVNPVYYFHLGSTACDGNVNDGFSCAASNQASIHLENFQVDKNTVVFDIASFFAQADLDHQVDPMNDGISGCMSFPGDPECPSVFGALGMKFEGQGAGDLKQSAFRAE